MNIAEILCQHAQLRPADPAIIDVHRGGTRVLSFGELDTESKCAAALLAGAGVKQGDGVLIFHPMAAELYTAMIGAFRLGAVPMFLDPSAGREHIDACCNLWPPAALVASAKAHLLRFRSAALRRIPVKFSIGAKIPGAIFWDRAGSRAADARMADLSPEAHALLTFTSGSTGVPKAAVRTHGFLLEQHRVLAESLRLKPREIDLTTLPIFVLANLGSGVCSLIPDADLRSPGKIQPAPVVQQIRTHQPSRTAASPAFLERLAIFCRENQVQCSEFRDIFVGGAPVFPNLLRQIHGVAPKARVSAVYGSTEAEPIAEIDYADIEPEDFACMVQGRGLLAGKPVTQIRLQVIQDNWGTPIGPFTKTEFQQRLVHPNSPGEIVVSGTHVLPGYLNSQGDSETKFDVDNVRWHRTGDAGYLDSRGRVWLLGRCDARIEDERGVLFPFAVECAAQQIDGIRRAALVAHQGRRLLAVELERSSDFRVLEKLRSEIAWANIDDVRVLPRIPVDKRHNAKVNYLELRSLLMR
jgi:olefin beta-lactone synthetase